jgi:hypothetical protein
MKRRFGWLAAIVLLAAAAPLRAYVIVLKDGSKVFGRAKYEVKRDFAVFTLESGNIAEIPLAKVDVPATETYNKENVGNVLILDRPDAKVLQTPKTTSTDRQNLSRYIQQQFKQPKAAGSTSSKSAPAKPLPAEISDAMMIREAIRILEGAGVTQYRLQTGPKVVLVADQDEDVFRALSAAARLAQDLTSLGKIASLEVEFVSSTGSEGGSFKMTADNVKDLTEGQITPSEYFVQNVIF